MKSTRKKLLQTLFFLILILALGVLGYHLIEGWPIFDAMYMTVITLATVGYGETHPLSPAGRVFTLFLIMGGMGIILYGITEFTSFIVEGEMTGILRRRRMTKSIEKMSNHYILCGCGDIGIYVLEELIRTKRPCVVIEQDPLKIRQMLERGIVIVEGDATRDDVLEAAGIRRAAGLVSALHTDRDNLFVVISARGLNPTLRIISKIDDVKGRDKFIRSGANAVVSAHSIGGLRLASELIRPATVSFLDTMLRDNSALRVEDILVTAKSRYVGKPLSSVDVLAKADILLVSIKQADGYHFHPPLSTILKADDTLVVIGTPDQLNVVREAFG
jgi:voltage-gated potassium channel